MEGPTRDDHVGRSTSDLPTLEVGHHGAGLGSDGDTRGGVPPSKPLLSEPVEVGSGHVAQLEGGGTWATHATGLTSHAGPFRKVAGAVVELVREPRGDDGLVEPCRFGHVQPSGVRRSALADELQPTPCPRSPVNGSPFAGASTTPSSIVPDGSAQPRDTAQRDAPCR